MAGNRFRWKSTKALLAGVMASGVLQACTIVSAGGGPGAGGDERFDLEELTARIVEGERLVEAGRPDEAIGVFLSIPDDAPADIRARALPSIREATALLSQAQLEAAVISAPPALRLQTPLLARYAATRSGEEARTLAERILAFGAEEPEATIARDILAGGPRGGLGALSRVGAILPEDASQGLREFGAEIRDGIQLALAFTDGADFELEVFDDRADARQTAAGIDSLVAGGAFGIIGPLFIEALAEAASARNAPIPLVSPTAQSIPDGSRGVYSLSSVDVSDAQILGEYAASRGFNPVVIVYPDNSDGLAEADAFRAALVASGGTAPREVSIDPDSAFFRDAFDEIRRIEPDAVVMLLNETLVQAFAPQYTFFGLDSLQAQRLGGAAWGAESVVSAVQPRHTDGVVAAVPVSPLGQGEAYLEFVTRYEETFQRGLVSDAPALGYDAALLLLAAAERARTLSVDPVTAFEGISELVGDTGILSVEGGRLVRRHHLVRIQNRTLVPIGG